jgi:hypothetical protein
MSGLSCRRLWGAVFSASDVERRIMAALAGPEGRAGLTPDRAARAAGTPYRGTFKALNRFVRDGLAETPPRSKQYERVPYRLTDRGEDYAAAQASPAARPRLVADVIAGHRDGWALEDLAGLYGTSAKAIGDLLRANGVDLCKGGIPTAVHLGPAGLARLAAEYDAGAGLVELGRRYQRDPATMAKLVRAGGGHIRPPVAQRRTRRAPDGS